MKLFCPECYTVFERDDACACADQRGSHVLLGAPGERPSMIGHLTLLDDTPRPWSLMEELCDGPRRFPEQLSAEARCCCWRHRARTVWVWQDNAENLPPAGMRPGEDSSSMSLLRLVTETGLLLVEAPQQTPLFRAHYARNKSKGSAAPEFALVIDRLAWAFSLSGARQRAIALLDPTGDAGAEDHIRLNGMSSAFGVFKQRAEALRWLLEKMPRDPRPPAPARHRAGADVAREDGGGKQPIEPGVVSVFDVGGSVMRTLLAQLHIATWAAKNSKPAKKGRKTMVTLPGRRWPQNRFQALATAAGLDYGRVSQGRDREPAPGSPVPQWAGRLTGWRWWKPQPFTLSLESVRAKRVPDALIVGVGSSRLFGERELSRLLERVWLGHSAPAAIIRHAQADEHVLRWVRNEFPRTPEFPDSAEGGLRALETALRTIRQRASNE